MPTSGCCSRWAIWVSEKVGEPQVVVVEKCDELAAGLPDAIVYRAGDALRGRVVDAPQVDPVVKAGQPITGGVGRSIVDYDQLEVPISLGRNALDGLPNVLLAV